MVVLTAKFENTDEVVKKMYMFHHRRKDEKRIQTKKLTFQVFITKKTVRCSFVKN